MAAQVQKIGEWLGAEPRNEFDLARLVRDGLSLKTQEILVANGLTKDEFHHIVIPLRTFQHRKERLNCGLPEALTPDESDKALRAARVLALAEGIFASREDALAWMRQPKRRLENKTPMHMLQTEAGARVVEQMLIQLDEGMFA